MTRLILAGLAAVVGVMGIVFGVGCQPNGVGDPCIPEQEYDPTYAGANYDEVGVVPGSFQCLTRLCLVNHFQGRVTCPYGQADGGAPVFPGSGVTAGCVTPGLQTNVSAAVAPQCISRQTAEAVYCSCRCENLNGATDDGANYCKCPSGFSCTQLVSSLGAGLDQGLTGGYCIRDGTAFSASATSSSTISCTGASNECGGESANCGPTDNTGGL
jgi:hypothetical protein